MKTFATFFSIFFFSSFILHAQTLRTSFRSEERVIDLEKNAGQEFLYLFDSFRQAHVYYPGEYAVFNMNLNILNDQMIIERPGEENQVLSPGRIDSIQIDDKTFIHHRRFGYLEIISGKTQKFHVKYHTSYTMQEIRQGAYGDAPATAAVQSVNILAGQAHTLTDIGEFLYLENQSGNPVRVSLVSRPTFGIIKNNEFITIESRRALNRLYPDHRSEIRSFLRDNDIEFDIRSDLIKLAVFIDRLL